MEEIDEKITLKIARTRKRLTLAEVAEKCGTGIGILHEYECDCSNMPISLARKIGKLYKISFDNIFIGQESDYYLD